VGGARPLVERQKSAEPPALSGLLPRSQSPLEGTMRPLVRITITPAAYAVIKASLAKGGTEPPPQRDAAGRFVIYVEETYVDKLKELRRFRENYSDVILRLAELEGTKAPVVTLAERG
jgi:hypothetical protein